VQMTEIPKTKQVTIIPRAGSCENLQKELPRLIKCEIIHKVSGTSQGREEVVCSLFFFFNVSKFVGQLPL
jgi:hypothetical protein